ncbi:MAG: AsmA-like C-terminal region-containing protein, partial [Pseudomonadota bacterium]
LIASSNAAISVVGLLQQLDGQGLSFDEVDARFRLTPRQVIVTESSAVGPGLGISLDGIYTLATQQMDFQGVVSPFYLINSIGSVLTRRGEGLIGFNFTIGGTSSAPQVGVNPLSAFTPGMFRDIFRRSPPQVSQ